MATLIQPFFKIEQQQQQGKKGEKKEKTVQQCFWSLSHEVVEEKRLFLYHTAFVVKQPFSYIYAALYTHAKTRLAGCFTVSYTSAVRSVCE